MLKAAILIAVALGSVASAAAARRSEDSLPRMRATAQRSVAPRRAVPPVPDPSRLIGLPLFIGLGIGTAVAVTVAVAASGQPDSEG
ncbi:hypothetical protein [Sphingomonas desiccabilis]|uniref:hypothetical protein n=1 Tax=Sphingomonas desiccabilis TaxID=429134 RepID=UPI001012B697|nr:hypothetical protein [Sphingomonas desiccabilis]MBB3911068.1 hypothetical protein [Sphingomonas desiccabilis]